MKTTVFISGGSQAVRIPMEFRIDARWVEIERKGTTLVLRPLSQKKNHGLKVISNPLLSANSTIASRVIPKASTGK